MAVIECKECGGQVSTSAKACPHCGAKLKKRAGILGWIFVLIFVIPMAWNIGKGIFTSNSKSSAQLSDSPSDLPAPSSPAQPFSKWERNEYRDAMTDETKTVLSLRSLNSAIFEFPYQKVGGSYLTLAFRKQKEGLDAYIVVDKGQMLCGIRDCSFSLRVDDGAVQKWTGLRSSTHESDIMFIRDAEQLEKIVRKGGKIRIGIDFHRAGTKAFDFDIGEYPGF
ncbi:zinc ribbon domain-containing protein [Azotobacter salinestris]|uniref:zinc ribbon domain-containing protein n=1 Tax=Azotobacter salinestris TaxID=69964 RepID=UPI0032DF84BD